MKACGVVVARLQGKSRMPHSSTGNAMNMGTVVCSPKPLRSQCNGGKVRRQLTNIRWGGASGVPPQTRTPINQA